MRLIDADEMRQDWLENGQNEYVYDTNAVLVSIDTRPTIDAVPVVRCRECKRWMKDVPGCTDFVGRCALANYMIGATGYCLYGERKDGEG